MSVIISCTLSEPPSSIHCFRDVTLFSSCFLKQDVLVECDPELQDMYWRWLKNRYSWDFIEDLIPVGSETGVSIREKGGSINVKRIDYDNLNFICSRLRCFLS